jgi:AcrR family transcriptional regulator
MTAGKGADETYDDGARRPYDSPVRRQAMEATRERIVTAGVELVRGFKTWDWTDLTFRAVAERAGVGERTVYRHFPTERILHSAIMSGLATEAGVDYDGVTLATVGDVAQRVFRALGSLHLRPALDPPPDSAFAEADRQRRDALLRAVGAELPQWSDAQRSRLAASLDLLWSAESYERLVDQWDLDPDAAMAIIAWAIDTLIGAVAEHDDG